MVKRGRLSVRQIDRDRQTSTETDRQAQRQTDRQTGKQTNRQKRKRRWRENVILGRIKRTLRQVKEKEYAPLTFPFFSEEGE